MGPWVYGTVGLWVSGFMPGRSLDLCVCGSLAWVELVGLWVWVCGSLLGWVVCGSLGIWVCEAVGLRILGLLVRWSVDL